MPAGRPHIVSYAAKWDETHVDYAGTKPVPLRGLAPGVVARIEEIARAAWQALGLRDYGRVDLRVDRDGQPWVIDVNPNCDISPDAGVARSAASAGMDYPALIRRIAETAWTRAVAPGAAARRSA
jgi:D-alanine-D-alanine ligase